MNHEIQVTLFLSVIVDHCLPQPHSQVLPFPQVLFGPEEGNYGNQDSNAERDGGAVDPDVSPHAAVLPDQEEDLQIQVQTHTCIHRVQWWMLLKNHFQPLTSFQSPCQEWPPCQNYSNNNLHYWPKNSISTLASVNLSIHHLTLMEKLSKKVPMAYFQDLHCWPERNAFCRLLTRSPKHCDDPQDKDKESLYLFLRGAHPVRTGV